MQLLTTKEVAEILKLHPNQVRAMCRAGKLPSFDICPGDKSVYRVSQADLEQFLEQNRISSPDPKPRRRRRRRIPRGETS